MADNQDLLFLRDPKRFMDVMADHDPEVRFEALKGSFADLAICEIMRYGVYNDQAMIGPLAQFYRELVMKAPEDDRFAIYGHVAGLVENTDFVSVNALLPFIAEDTSRRIVSTATIDYVSCGPLTDGDPMSRVRDITGMIESGQLENEGAAFGALLNLGDDRVCKLLVALRDTLDKDAVVEASNCTTGFMYAPTAEFWMDWLEGMEGDIRDALFGVVASGLALLHKRAQAKDVVFDGRRPFPGKGTPQAEWVRLRRQIPIAEYVRKIERRMQELERSEPPPRVMPHVLVEWGIKPATDPAETVVLDDRLPSPATPAPTEAAGVPSGLGEVRGEWWTDESEIYIAWGILNPNGPTLYCLGSREVDGRQRTYFRWLHMLGGSTTWAATEREHVSYQGLFEDARAIGAFLASKNEPPPFNVIPNFVAVSGQDETMQEVARRLVAGSPCAKSDWGKYMAYQRAFGFDFFARAGAEIRAFYEDRKAELSSQGKPLDELRWIEARYGHIPDFQNAKIPAWTPAELTPAILEEWWSSMDSDEYRGRSLVALRSMWEGACGIMEGGRRRDLVPWSRIQEFLGSRFVLRA